MYAKPQLKEVALDAESSYCCQMITVDLSDGVTEAVNDALGDFGHINDPTQHPALGGPGGGPNVVVHVPPQLACLIIQL